jgi:hypothetical protein
MYLPTLVDLAEVKLDFDTAALLALERINDLPVSPGLLPPDQLER